MKVKMDLDLDCGHSASAEFRLGVHQLPAVGRTFRCPACTADRTIVECQPEQVDIETRLLSDVEPSQDRSGFGSAGYTEGTRATVFWDCRDASWGYCYHGVGRGGNAFETEDVLGFATPEDAWRDAESAYAES